MKAFDPNYKLLDEMYQDNYYPTFLVDKVKDELQKRSSICWRAAKPTLKWCRRRWTRRSAASMTSRMNFMRTTARSKPWHGIVSALLWTTF